MNLFSILTAAVIAFQPGVFIAGIAKAVILGISLFGALALVAEDRSKDKIETYLVAASCFAFVFWFLSLFVLFESVAPIVEIGGLVWLAYKWLDFSILRSLLALVVYLILNFIFHYLLFSIAFPGLLP